MPNGLQLPAGVTLKAAVPSGAEHVLTAEALDFLAGLHRAFEGERQKRLSARIERQRRFDAGELPRFLPETAAVREGSWRVRPAPADLLDRRVEITGPTDQKMVINALNSGARVFMADFEDANAPTFANMVEGQANMMARWRGTLGFTDAASGKAYKLGSTPATLIVRPRGWHLPEAHVEVDGQPMSGALFDFGLYVFHCAKAALAAGSGPYFYLPKMESHLEARLWSNVFVAAEIALGFPKGTIRATVLIETLPAAFEMDEILYELKDHILGLNCGRWDYIFSFIKTLRNHKAYILPDRSQVVMGKAFLRNYSLLLIKTCHRRGAFAMGGMAAQIPNRKDPEANAAAFTRVKADKEREASDGHDGTWVAHPDLVPVAMEVFDRLMPQANQLGKTRDDVSVTAADLLQVHEGTRTEACFRENIRVGIQYIEAWLRGRGAVPLYNLMEDAATAEISRSQNWQWLKFGVTLEGGQKVTKAWAEKLISEEVERIRSEVGADAFAKGRFPEAIEIFRTLSTADQLEAFLTLPAYRKL